MTAITRAKQATELLQRASDGDEHAASELLPLVYDELRGLAGHLMKGERKDHSLQPTALVHEAYLRLIGNDDHAWHDRRHFFNAAAIAMRRCLIDRGRRRQRVKHGGEMNRIPFDDVELRADREFSPEEIEMIDSLLTELGGENERWAQVVNLRLFLDLSVKQVAGLLGISVATVKNDWRFALAWLRVRLDSDAADKINSVDS